MYAHVPQMKGKKSGMSECTYCLSHLYIAILWELIEVRANDHINSFQILPVRGHYIEKPTFKLNSYDTYTHEHLLHTLSTYMHVFLNSATQIRTLLSINEHR